jgi:hypothetical protein
MAPAYLFVAGAVKEEDGATEDAVEDGEDEVEADVLASKLIFLPHFRVKYELYS